MSTFAIISVNGQRDITDAGSISYKSGSIDPSALTLKLTSLDGGNPQSRIRPLAVVGRRVPVSLEDESSCAELLRHSIETDAFV